MADTAGRRGRVALRLAPLLLLLAAGGLWGASRLAWVSLRSFDGLGQPKEVTVVGAAWSTALLPLVLLALAAAIATVAVRGWPLRVLAVLTAAASLAAGYLAISMWVGKDVIARAADIADVPVISLVGSDRHNAGAALTLIAALCMLAGAALLLRSAAPGRAGAVRTAQYVAPASRRSTARSGDTGPGSQDLSERMLWDALDEGRDLTDEPTDGPNGRDAQGR